MRTKLFFLAGFFGALPVFILILSFYLLFLLNQTHNAIRAKYSFPYPSLPLAKDIVDSSLSSHEEKVSALRNFFSRYGSPLFTYSENMVLDAEKYGLDFRLLPAIAMQESTLCQKAPLHSYNCWGFGIYGGKVTSFPDFPTAIDTISMALARDYKAKGLESPYEIMPKYTPASNGSWAQNVSYIMSRIQNSL